ncbi:esterase FE4-like [Bombyx mandarina]|uniref:Carboxylic ester hydrolase n=1 Tax=Bombyx mandarina TaxID=7092 RepID=A0A6J2JPV4_BOMMA|nr:esterase FE4-like [Bombyx mandarina]
MAVTFPIVILTLTLINNIDAISRIDPLVETKVGLIKGLRSDNNDFSLFLGVPYAKVNRSNPFGVSIPYPSFLDTFEAFQESPRCPQASTSSNQSLDCLSLNIYVPTNATSQNKLPVMVWIHGGAFSSGSGSRDSAGPEFLIRYDVILVTVYYRLGPYGFMCLDHPEVAGNQGLKDQLMALRWINENIEAFGGDANKITIFGESAGGHSVELHLLSQAEILYNRVILQSGSAEARTVLIEPDKSAPLKIADRLGHTTDNIEEALTFLSSASTESVITAASSLGIEFKPCAENPFEQVDSFITKRWANAKIPKVANIPVLIGFNDHELMITHVLGDAQHFASLDIFTTYLNKTFNFDSDTLEEMTQYVRQFYIGDDPITEEKRWEIINYDSDFVYIHPIQRTINKFIEGHARNIYYYMFSYDGGRNLVKVSRGINAPGVAHADELGYIFSIKSLSNKTSPEDQLMVDRMTTMWTNFAKFGDPIPETTELLPIKWDPITKDSYNYLKIDSVLTLGNRPYKERMTLWDLFYKLNEKKQKYYDESNEDSF